MTRQTGNIFVMLALGALVLAGMEYYFHIVAAAQERHRQMILELQKFNHYQHSIIPKSN